MRWQGRPGDTTRPHTSQADRDLIEDLGLPDVLEHAEDPKLLHRGDADMRQKWRSRPGGYSETAPHQQHSPQRSTTDSLVARSDNRQGAR